MYRVALIDEIDILLTKTQNVLYTLLNWPHKNNSKFVVIGISNMIDLPEKMLPRCKSRLGFAHVRFMPYSAEQIQAILEQRLLDCGSLSNGLPIFHANAIDICAKRVAVLTGDVRAALRMCSRALELTPRGQQVTVKQMSTASGEHRESIVTSTVKTLPREHRALLCAILTEKRNCQQQGQPWPPLLKCFDSYLRQTAVYGNPTNTSLRQIRRMLNSMSSLGLLYLEQYCPMVDKGASNPEARLGFSEVCGGVAPNTAGGPGGGGRGTDIDVLVDEEGGDILVVVPDVVEEDIRPGLVQDSSFRRLLADQTM
eukprot:GHVS01014148.1.p1 GENE.GHVS01014148.1~~GHVS01014148.1.p1  ORF type:complete len:312 (-),score=47.23 GHVS01014148.1:127-1062(-)